MVRSILLAAATSLALAACATETTTAANDAAPGRDCIGVRSINGFSAVDDHHIKVSAGPNRDYILTTQSRMNSINFQEQIGVQSTTDWLCTGNGLGVRLVIPHGIPDTYYVSEVVRAPEAPPPAPQGS